MSELRNPFTAAYPWGQRGLECTCLPFHILSLLLVGELCLSNDVNGRHLSCFFHDSFEVDFGILRDYEIAVIGVCIHVSNRNATFIQSYFFIFLVFKKNWFLNRIFFSKK